MMSRYGASSARIFVRPILRTGGSGSSHSQNSPEPGIPLALPLVLRIIPVTNKRQSSGGCLHKYLGIKMPNHWTIAAPHAGQHELAEHLRISPLTAQVLCNRGLSDFEEAKAFFDPKLNDLLPPSALDGTEKAADLVRRDHQARPQDRHLRRLRRGRHHRHGHPVAGAADGRGGRRLLHPAPAGGRLRPQRTGHAANRCGRSRADHHGRLRHHGLRTDPGRQGSRGQGDPDRPPLPARPTCRARTCSSTR